MPVSLRTVAVDLTPLLPGGENGGAKLFALELVRRLAERAPETSFVLLTQAASHAELAVLERDNVRRVQVMGAATSAGRARLFGSATRALARAPHWVKRRAAAAGHRLHRLLKRSGSRRLLRDLGADLLFCPFTAPTFQEPGVATVCTIYDLQFSAYPQFFAVEDVVQRERAFAEACRGATRLAAISDFSRAAATAHGALDPRRIRTIGLHGLAQPGFAPSASIDPPYLLYPANFWRHKNHEMLLAAFGIACRRGLPAEVALVCTGAPGARRDELARAARALGLGERVRFPGFLPRDDLMALLAGARGVVFPSLYEGFGLPVVEAMAAGVPVACSDVTALPEVAGDAALLFDPRMPERVAAALVALAGDESLRARLIAAGRRRAEAFADAEAMARQYWELFVEAAAEATTRAAA